MPIYIIYQNRKLITETLYARTHVCCALCEHKEKKAMRGEKPFDMREKGFQPLFGESRSAYIFINHTHIHEQFNIIIIIHLCKSRDAKSICRFFFFFYTSCSGQTVR